MLSTFIAAKSSSQLLFIKSFISALCFFPLRPRLFIISELTSCRRSAILPETIFQSTASFCFKNSVMIPSCSRLIRSRITTISSCLRLTIKNTMRNNVIKMQTSSRIFTPSLITKISSG